MKRHKLVITVVIFIIVFLSTVQVAVSNRLSTDGIMLGKIEDEIRFYKAQNSFLSEELFLASSLNNIASKAAAFGFIENKSQFVLKTSLPFALKSP